MVRALVFMCAGSRIAVIRVYTLPDAPPVQRGLKDGGSVLANVLGVVHTKIPNGSFCRVVLAQH